MDIVIYLFNDLVKCRIGAEGAKHLMNGYWPKLKYLYIGNNMLI